MGLEIMHIMIQWDSWGIIPECEKVFIVNFTVFSDSQALFVLLFLPFLSNLKGIPFAELPLYLKSGAGCLLNLGANTSGKFLCLGLYVDRYPAKH